MFPSLAYPGTGLRSTEELESAVKQWEQKSCVWPATLAGERQDLVELQSPGVDWDTVDFILNRF